LIEEHEGAIRDWADFESYPWPRVDDIDLKTLDWMEKNVPEGMGCFELTAHIFEMVNFPQGHERLCYNLFDNPALVAAINDLSLLDTASVSSKNTSRSLNTSICCIGKTDRGVGYNEKHR